MELSHLEYFDFSPDVNAYRETIHYEVLEDEAMDKADEVLSIAKEQLKPSFGGIVLPIESFTMKEDLGSVVIDGRTFTGPPLVNLKHSCLVAPYFATCGMQLEKLDATSIDFMAPFWIDTLKKQALNQVRKSALHYFKDALGSDIISSINPGSGNVGYWDVSNLKPIFEILSKFSCLSDIKLSDNMYMIPNKSVCGIFFPSKEEFVTCSECTRENCPSRRAKFKERV